MPSARSVGPGFQESVRAAHAQPRRAAARFPAATNRESPPRSGRLASAMPAHPLAESGERRAILAPRRQPKGTESRRRARALRSGSTEGQSRLARGLSPGACPEEFDGNRGRRSHLRGRACRRSPRSPAGRAAHVAAEVLSGIGGRLSAGDKNEASPPAVLALIFDVAAPWCRVSAKKSRLYRPGRCLGEGCVHQTDRFRRCEEVCSISAPRTLLSSCFEACAPNFLP